jgi:hypothetical protein
MQGLAKRQRSEAIDAMVEEDVAYGFWLCGCEPTRRAAGMEETFGGENVAPQISDGRTHQASTKIIISKTTTERRRKS